jgi:hypothetical protein
VTRRALLAAGAAIGAFALGYVLAPAGHPEPGTPVVTTETVPRTSLPPFRASGPGPRRLEGGVPLGYARTRAGAVAAAGNYAATLGGPLFLEPARYRAALGLIAAPELRPRLRVGAAGSASYLDAETGLLSRRRRGEPAIARTVPIGYAVDEYRDRRVAAVRVWFTSVMGRAARPGVVQSWGTITLRLRWMGDWRLAGWSDATGPAPPAVGDPRPDAASAALITATTDLREFTYAPALP